MITTTTVPAGSAPSPREEASSDAGALRWAGLSGVGFVVLVAAKLIDNITAASLAFSHTYGASPQEARITAGLAYWVQGASMAGASALLAAASILARRARQVPAWAAVAGYVLAAVGPASVALNGVPILLFFVWIVAAGIVLTRSGAASPGAHRVSRERRAAHGP